LARMVRDGGGRRAEEDDEGEEGREENVTEAEEVGRLFWEEEEDVVLVVVELAEGDVGRGKRRLAAERGAEEVRREVPRGCSAASSDVCSSSVESVERPRGDWSFEAALEGARSSTFEGGGKEGDEERFDDVAAVGVRGAARARGVWGVGE
jgi:hypothetical protein